MTPLRKPVKRVTVNVNLTTRRKLVVSLFPGDVIGIRELGRRKTYVAPLGRVFLTIARWNAEAERIQKVNDRRKERGIKPKPFRVQRGKL